MENEFDLRLTIISLLRKAKPVLLFVILGLLIGGGFRVVVITIVASRLQPPVDDPEPILEQNSSWQTIWLTKRIFYVYPYEMVPEGSPSTTRDISMEAILTYELLGVTTDAVSAYNAMVENPLSTQDLVSMVCVAASPAARQVIIYSVGEDSVASELLGNVIFDDLNGKIAKQLGRYEISPPIISTTQGESPELIQLIRGNDARGTWIVSFINSHLISLNPEMVIEQEAGLSIEGNVNTVTSVLLSLLKYALLGAAICGGLSVIFIFFVEAVSVKVESAKELRDKTGLRLLCSISGRKRGYV